MKKNDTLAIVVTYNRKELLKENIDALLGQTFKKFDILVIDNNSSDGTNELLNEFKNKYDNIDYIKLSENIGGAGGFNKGMKEAMMRGYKYAWLMDDDTIPEKKALETLIEAKELLKNNFSFLCSLVKWNDKKLANMNVPAVEKDFLHEYDKLEKGLVSLESCSFVSCFIDLDNARKYGLPIKEFFIYFDDMEYTRRISKERKAYLVLESKVFHKMKFNNGTTAEKMEDINKVKRLKYDYRNGFFIAKKKGLRKALRYIFRYIYHLLKVIFTRNKFKIYKIKYMTLGLIQGIFFNPKIEYVEKEK